MPETFCWGWGADRPPPYPVWAGELAEGPVDPGFCRIRAKAHPGSGCQRCSWLCDRTLELLATGQSQEGAWGTGRGGGGTFLLASTQHPWDLLGCGCHRPAPVQVSALQWCQEASAAGSSLPRSLQNRKPRSWLLEEPSEGDARDATNSCGSMERGGWQRWLLLLVGIQLASGQCPEQCQCIRTAQVECSGAGITAVPSPIPANAMTLQIINTRIAELGDASFGNASLLIGLRIEKNNLSRISPGAFQHLPDLRYLSLASNKLQELPVQVFEPLGKLESLLLSSNQILQVEPSHFAHLSNLKELQLHGNNLQELKEGVFDQLTSLTKLNLARNNIDRLPPRAFERLARLQVLRLYENRLRQIPAGAFDGLPELQELGLHQNQLEMLSPELFVHNGNLQKLYLSNNLLATLPSGIFLPLRALAKITLHVNRLRDISPSAFGPMPDLRELWLYENELSTLPAAVFSNLTQLQLLVLSKNRLRSVAPGAFRGLGEVLELSLHSNALRRLDTRALEGMPKLQNISLHHNQLQALPRGLFGATPGLQHLQLHSNALEYLPAGIFSPLATLREVRLHNNSWRCDEGILPLRGWLEDNPHKVGETPPLCAQPPTLRGTPIARLPRDQLLAPRSPTASPHPSTPLPARPSEVALPAGAWTEPPTGLPVSPRQEEKEEEEEERGRWGLTRMQSGVVVAVIVLVCVALLAALVALVVYGCRKKSHVVLMRMKAPNEA
ncbi:leucine-rich repeat-containing protein 15-like isoform X1 [Harpia harpyja]|uniref:leucine-rich repeat-containing protein 15-like isoform X1 n=2 Tax=Harpia harpyja TaxID=202280 RepID=UPI0022B14C30|nr:leucine-rich repeat-containing protein 15-like isoform X1 [Harpia harpyja]